MKKSRQGQSTLEYAVLVAVVVGGLLAMQIYMKRGLQGKLHQSADAIGGQFEAQQTSVGARSSHTAKTVQTVQSGVTETKIDLAYPDTRTESGDEDVSNW